MIIQMERVGIDGFATHFPILAAAVHRTTGAVLELGAGHYSTPLLHFLCLEPKRRLVTVESNSKWLETFRRYATDWHELLHVPSQDLTSITTIDETHWSVVFIDHAPGSRRPVEINRVKNRAEYIVVHDTHKSRDYGYEPLLSSFRFRSDWKAYSAWTSVVSMVSAFKI